MTIQQVVYRDIGHGIPGELAFDGPLRATAGMIDLAADAANCVVGRYFSKNRTTGAYTPGGDPETDVNLTTGGVAGSPKSGIAYGLLNDPFAASLNLLPGSVTDFFEMATPWVSVAKPAKVGDIAVYTITTGVISTVTPAELATLPATELAIPNAVVYRVGTTNADGGIIAIKLTN